MRTNTDNHRLLTLFVAGGVLASIASVNGIPLLAAGTDSGSGGLPLLTVASDGTALRPGPPAALRPGVEPAVPPAALGPCDIGPSLATPCVAGPSAAPRPLLTAATWNNATASGSAPGPLATAGAAAAYDPALGGTIVFGGCASRACPNNATWLFAGGAWTNLTPTAGPAPPARTNASLVYDPPAGALVLFGGLSGSNHPLSDTWTFANGTWSVWAALPAHPSARWGAAVTVFTNATFTELLLFGGCPQSTCTGPAGDTWTWTPTAGWVQLLPATSPAPVGGAALSMDTADGYAVLVGGGTDSPAAGWSCPGGYWTFANGSWTSHVLGSPPARAFATMTMDGSTSELLLFGGVNGTTRYNDSWSFARGSWSLLAPRTQPSPRALAAASDAAPVPVLFGGACTPACGPSEDVWVYEVRPEAGASASPARTDVDHTVDFSGLGTGGTAPYRYLWSFGDNASSLLPSPVHAYAAKGTFAARLSLIDALGVPAVGEVNVSVDPLPSLRFLSEPAAGDAGVPAGWSVGPIDNGTAPDAFLWSFGDGANGTGTNATHTYSAAGDFTIVVTLTDSVGARCNATASFTVHPALSVAISTVPADPVIGQPVVFLAGTSGGTSPVTVNWAFGDNATSTVSSPIHTYARGGNETVTATVVDAVGGRAVGTLTIFVAAAGGGTGAGPLFYVALLTSAAAIVLAIPALFLHYRRKSRAGASPNPDRPPEDPWMTARRRVRRLRK